MSILLETLGIDRLSVSERLDLIETIWDSLPDSISTQEVPEWRLQELERRYADALARSGEGKPWREVLGDRE